jgi:putative transposase
MAATQDETLVAMAFRMAWLARRPRAGLLFHSERGSQSTSDGYQAVLREGQVMVSMSRTGNCYDNAVTESFFSTLKTECIEGVSCQSRAQARQAIFEYTEGYSNRMRRHSSPGYKSPVIYEQLMC